MSEAIMEEHHWTTGDGVEHVAYKCPVCGKWFDSPSLHMELAEPMWTDAEMGDAVLRGDLFHEQAMAAEARDAERVRYMGALQRISEGVEDPRGAAELALYGDWPEGDVAAEREEPKR